MGLPAPEVATSAAQLELPDTVIPAKAIETLSELFRLALSYCQV